MAVPKVETAVKISKVGKKQVKGFMDFIKSQGVMGLAVGLVLGAAVTSLVKSIIDNLIMPPIGFVLGSANGIKDLRFILGTTPSGETVTMPVGMFLNELINFCVIAFVVYVIVKLLHVEIKK